MLSFFSAFVFSSVIVLMTVFLVQIHLLNERRPRLLPFEDSDLSLLIENNIESANAKVYNDVELLDLDQNGPGGKVKLLFTNEMVAQKICVVRYLHQYCIYKSISLNNHVERR